MAEQFEVALKYHQDRQGEGMAIRQNGVELFRYRPDVVHALASGTKSFWSGLVQIAIANGLFEMDEPIVETITEWKKGRRNKRKRGITVRHLLSFTSGLDPAVSLLRGNAWRSDNFADVMDVRSLNAPGVSFAYGPSHLFMLGVFLQRRLEQSGTNVTDPVFYLRQELFSKIGLIDEDWQRDNVKNPTMPFGAKMTVIEWQKYGEWILNLGETPSGEQLCESAHILRCFVGTAAMPMYGLNFWLGVMGDGTSVISMAGAKVQRQFILPEEKLIITRTGDSQKRGWDDFKFIQMVRDAL